MEIINPKSNIVIKQIQTGDTVCSLTLLPQGEIAAGMNNGEICIIYNQWEVKTRLKHGGSRVNCLLWEEEGGRLWSGGVDNVIILWDIGNQTKYKTLTQHESYVEGLGCWGGKVYSAGMDNKIIEWDIKGELINTLTDDIGIDSMKIFGDRMITKGCIGGFCVWDLTSRTKLVKFSPHSSHTYGSAIEQVSQNVYISGGRDDKKVKLVEISTKKVLNEYDAQSPVLGIIKLFL